MKQKTTADYAKILEKAIKKANAKSQPINRTTAPTPAELPASIPTPAPAVTPQPKPVFNAPTNNKTSLSAAIARINANNIIPDNDNIKATTPEMSNITFDDLINTTPATPAQAEVKPQEPAQTATERDIAIEEYNSLSFVVRGKDTYPIREQLRAKGGVWNRFLKCGPAWIFSKKKYYTIKTLIENTAA